MSGGWLAQRAEVNRLEPALRRMIRRLQRDLHATPWETLRGLVKARIARREMLAQQRELLLLADPTAEGGRWLVAIWNAQRRDTELLALLERLPNPADRPPTLAEYLEQRSTVPPTAPTSSAATVAADAIGHHRQSAAAVPQEEPTP